MRRPIASGIVLRMTPRRTKKLLNNPEDAILEALAGFGAAYPEIVRVDLEHRLALRRDAPIRGKVGVVSGGGSGHEPLHLGFVGQGMLDAAVLGPIFSSPVPGAIVAATHVADGDAGVVHIVKNYTGDVMNFRLAAKIAESEGVRVEMALVDDDVAIEDPLSTAGRRGTGATVLVERIAGACAERGGSLEAVAAVARRVNERSRSFGVALSPCSPPELGHPTFELGDDEIELGVGIHGEAGRRRGRIAPAATLVAEMVDAILLDLRPEPGADVLAFVNGLGATPLMELYLVHHDLVAELARRDLQVRRRLVGNYVTSLDMAGVSITLLVLDDELTELWDSPVWTAGLRWRL